MAPEDGGGRRPQEEASKGSAGGMACAGAEGAGWRENANGVLAPLPFWGWPQSESIVGNTAYFPPFTVPTPPYGTDSRWIPAG